MLANDIRSKKLENEIISSNYVNNVILVNIFQTTIFFIKKFITTL